MNARKIAVIGAVALVVIGCVLAAGCTSTTTTTTDSNLVKNDAMNIIGISEDGVDRFLGIPYAEPPVGELRFAPPVAKEPWTETLDCTEYGNAAIQDELLVGDSPVSEDCLYLNVWKPSDAKPGDKLPVYVWIHGGAHCYGSSSQDTYDGTQFAKDGVILVSVNYRLGTLGYLSLQTLMDEYGTAGNWATLDQIMALQWVQDNISKFGGDPDNVTVGGESAGSFSTFNLIMSPKAKGLFQKAIMESGAITYAFANKEDLDMSIEIGREVAEHFGADDSPEGLEILRKVDAMELWEFCIPNLLDLTTGSPYSCYPVYDGVVLPAEGPYQALLNGNYNKDVTILFGNNDKEGLAFVNTSTLTQESFDDFIKRTFREDSYQEVIDYYAAQTDLSLADKSAQVLGQTFMTLGVCVAESEMSKAGVSVYAYDFNYTDSYGNEPAHSYDMPFAFGQDTLMTGQPMQESDLKVRDGMHAAWVNFIKTGNPNGEGLPEWPLFDYKTKTIMEISENPHTITRPNDDLMEFLAPRYFPQP